jgi:hypothetical protein
MNQLRLVKLRKRRQRIAAAEKMKDHYLATHQIVRASAMDKFITWAKANLNRE